MRLYPEKLAAHLAKGAKPVYLFHGDEPFQMGEAADRLRAHAQDAGFGEREVIVANEDSDWEQFRESVDSLSLFAERRLIELRLPSGKPGRVGGDALKRYAAAPPDDILLVISSARLDRSGSSSAWFKAIDKVGATMAIQQVAAAQLPVWLGHRLRAHGLHPAPEALALIAERTEGNLLAASQEIERLALLYPVGEITAEQVVAAVADSARYSVTDLAAATLAGEQLRALRILRGLRDEAVAETLVVWTLAQEIRTGARAAEAMAAGVSPEAAMKSAGVWQNRAGPLKLALDRHPAESWLLMLSTTSLLDRQVKGQASGRPWDVLEALVARLAGSSAVGARASASMSTAFLQQGGLGR